MTAQLSDQGAEVIAARLVEELTDRLQNGGDVEAFIAEHPDHGSTLRRLLPAARVMAELSRSKDADIGAVLNIDGIGELGDFRLIREVGHGGMGVVYEAEQISLRRKVALKILPFAAAMDPKHLQRFHNEALAAASLHHEHIVPVYAVGSDRGVHFYAMQFIEGHTLADSIVARGSSEPARSVKGTRNEVTGDYNPNSPTNPIAALSTKLDGPSRRAEFRRAAEMIADAADALEYAHSVGIIHRDIKPGNLLIDTAGKLWVADFGLARFGPDAGLTMSGDLLGTLRYMAPEQALARHGLADHRVDVYGLGCTLYELLTGKPVIGGEDKADIVRRIAFEEPIALRKLDKLIPAELETIALKCLAKNPNERYATAGDLAADLRRFLGDKAIKAKPPGPRERIIRWVRRNRALTAASAIVFIVAVLAAGGSVGYVLSERAGRLALTQQKAQAALTAVRDAIASGDLALAGRQLAEARGQIGVDGGALPALTIEIDRAQAEIDTRLADEARFQKFVKLAGDAQDRAGFLASRGGNSVGREALALYGVLDADDWLARVQGSTLTAAEKSQVRQTAYLTLVSVAESEVRDLNAYHRTVRAEASLDLLERAERFHEPTRAFYFARAHYYRSQGNVAAADADEKRFEATPARTAWDHYLPGRMIQVKALPGGIGWPRSISPKAKNEIDGAIRAYRAALTIQPNHYNALFFLAQCLEWKENYAEAIGLFSACLAVGPVQGRPDVYAHRSWCYRQIGQKEAADADYVAALAVERESFDSQVSVVDALYEQGQFEDELTILHRLLIHSPDNAHLHFGLGDCLHFLRRNGEAVAEYRQAIKLSPDDANVHNNLGNAFSDLGKLPEAEAEYRTAIQLMPDLVVGHYNLANSLLQQGRYLEAESEYRGARDLGVPNSDWPGLFERLRRLADLDAKLSAILSGKASPNNATEQLDLAILCGTVKKLNLTAVKFYTAAFAADPKLVDDLEHGHRYNAACAAALAACGLGKDADKADDAERFHLRRQAFDWLTADLAAWAKFAGKPSERPKVWPFIQHWLEDTDLTGVRGDAIDKLPPQERDGWRKLWADVDALLKVVN